jgi:hypothetical protein
VVVVAVVVVFDVVVPCPVVADELFCDELPPPLPPLPSVPETVHAARLPTPTRETQTATNAHDLIRRPPCERRLLVCAVKCSRPATRRASSGKH